MEVAPIPPLFDRVPPGLFSPLGSALAPIHWDALARIYQCEFEREPFHVVRTVAVEIVEDVLVRSAEWQERREELLRSVAEEAPADADASDGAPASRENADAPSAEAAVVRSTARRILQRLERAGWFYFEYRSTLGHVLNFFPYAARILEVLVRVARDEQPVFQGYAHSIASLLKPESYGSKPGVAILEAKRNTLEMVRELKILNRNIFASTQRLVDEVATAAGVLEESFEAYRQKVQASYHRLKTVDNLYRFRGDILHRLDAIERDERSMETAARWYAEQHGIDAAAALGAVRSDVALLRMQFETLPEITDDIDARNARFSGIALRKLTYLLQQDRRLEGQLQILVDAHTRESDPEIAFDVYRCELLGSDFLYTAPKRREKVAAQPLVERARVDEQRLRAEVTAALRRPFARDRLEELVDRVLGARGRASLTEFPLAVDDDYVRAIFLVAFGLDGRSSFAFEQRRGDYEERGIYRHPAGDVARRTKSKRKR